MVRSGVATWGKMRQVYMNSRNRKQPFSHKFKDKMVKIPDRKEENSKELNMAFLNVDGLNPETLIDIKRTMEIKKIDLACFVETKRRVEDVVDDANIQGYNMFESRRSDAAGDRDGGGILVYARLTPGIEVRRINPRIAYEHLQFLEKERMWVTLSSQCFKTAVCTVYAGCQYSDNRYETENISLYQVLQEEVSLLETQGYRVIILGDLNGHIGSEKGIGIPGNKPSINKNGRLIINFVHETGMKIINQENQVEGVNSVQLCKGLWTRQRAGNSTILDYVLISTKHLTSVLGMQIDDQGVWGGGSDHNWLFIRVFDKFCRKLVKKKKKVPKQTWNIKEDQNWEGYREYLELVILQIDKTSVQTFAETLVTTLYNGMCEKIGEKSVLVKPKEILYTPLIIQELKVKRKLEREWKTNVSNFSSQLLKGPPPDEVMQAEQSFNRQNDLVKSLLNDFWMKARKEEIRLCEGESRAARKRVWSHVSKKARGKSDVETVRSPVTGVLYTDGKEILNETEIHLQKVFNGVFTQPQEPDMESDNEENDVIEEDHGYWSENETVLKSVNESRCPKDDPAGFMNSEIKLHEVKEMMKLLESGKATGWDTLPNECLKELPPTYVKLLMELFSMLLETGEFPTGWNVGRLVLIHKKDEVELLKNYRPLTVINSVPALYAKILNNRLATVVEIHGLLGESQNGFRKGRSAADNTFVLNTMMWKVQTDGKRSHLGFVDIEQAYDSVNREKLFKILKQLGLGSRFVRTVKSMYTGDSIITEQDGVKSRPLYLGQGVRQGCSLSPLLFALYLRNMGLELNKSNQGITLSGVCISALLFADDIVLASESAEGLQKLLEIVKFHCTKLNMKISVKKSQIISPDDRVMWTVLEEDGTTSISLKKVLEYKYLGVQTGSSYYQTRQNWQKRALDVANKYKWCCMRFSKLGPDKVMLGTMAWTAAAVPSILFGCETIPIADKYIEDIERTQATLGKYLLGLPPSAPNILVQTELGILYFRHKLYSQVLKYYTRVLLMNKSRWPALALDEHLRRPSASPYFKFIHKIRTEVGLLEAPLTMECLHESLQEHFINKVNSSIARMSLIGLRPLREFEKQLYVCENKAAETIAKFRLNRVDLGKIVARENRRVQTKCPLCPTAIPMYQNSPFHIVMECNSLKEIKKVTGLSIYVNLSMLKNVSPIDTYRNYLSGVGLNGEEISRKEILERGEVLKTVVEYYLSRW